MEGDAAITVLSEANYRDVFERHPLPMWVYDCETLEFLAVSDAAVARYGYSRTEFLTMSIADIRPPDERARLLAAVASIPETTRTVGVFTHRRKNGTTFEVEITTVDVQFGGRAARLVVSNEVARTGPAEERVLELSRLHRTSSEINKLVVRTDDRAALLAGACRTLVGLGGFRMAWIGFVDPGSSRVVCAARAGEGAEYLDDVEVRADESPLGRGPVGRALRSGKHVVIHRTASDSAVAPWRDLQLGHGFRSSAAFPIRRRGHVSGVLTVYGAEDFAFGDEEVALLDGLADDLGYALEALNERFERKAAEEALRRQHATLAGILESTSEPVFSLDRDLRYTSFNPAHSAAMRSLYGTEVALGSRLLDMMTVEADREAALRNMNRVLDGSSFTLEASSGDERLSRRSFEVAHNPVREANGNIAGVAVFARDVTVRKESEARTRRLNGLFQTINDVNEAILRASDREGLLEEAARILVERDELSMVTFGFADAESGRVVSALAAGLGTDYLDSTEIRFDDTPLGRGPTGTAIRQGRPTLVADIAADPAMAPWSAAQLARGFRSTAAFPLRRRGAVTGALTVYASEAFSIGVDEMALLDRLAGDIGFALDAFESLADRDRAARALRESEVRIRSLFDGMLEGYAHCRMVFEDGVPVDWLYLDVNPAFSRITGLRDVVGKTVTEVIPGIRDINPGLMAAYQKVASTGQPLIFDSYLQTLGIWLSVSAYCPRAGEFVAVFHDITERKRAEAELTKLYRAVEASPAAVVITNPQGLIEYVNPKFTAVSGYSRGEVLGKTPNVLKSGETPPEVYRELWETISAGGEWRGEFHNRRKDGTLFWELASISPVRDPEGAVTHFVAVKEDITERKRAEAELVRSQEQLRQVQKMEAVGRLAGGVAHDFNNLLTVIRGYSELLAATLEDDPVRRDHVGEIVRAADRAAALTRQLLAFSRQQVLETRVLDLRSVMLDSEKMLRRLIGEDIVLVVTAPGVPALVRADAGQLEQVFLNLAVNARDAMPRGGRLTIGLSLETLDAARPSAFDAIPPGRYVSVEVADTGEGMDAETLARIFEPFFTTKEKGRGTGLGLATVFGIVKQSGGFLTVRSRPGEGSTFHVLLPEVQEAVPGDPAPPARAEARRRGTETILLVEDEAAIRDLTRRLLERNGYAVLVAEGGDEALAKARDHPGTIHLVLSDLVMPGLSGPEVARAVLAVRPSLRVLFMSGYSHDILTRQGMAGDLDRLLQKPFKEADLLLRVREALDAPA